MGLLVTNDGADGGIDLRFKDKKGGTVIIQCKRYKAITATINSMKKEVSRVSRIAPARYMVATVLDLSDKSKQRLVKMFASVDLKEQDSTNTLTRIFKARVYNYSEF